MLGFIALALTYRRLPLSNFCYVCVFLHTLVLIYGGYYTYAETPLGNWASAIHFQGLGQEVSVLLADRPLAVLHYGNMPGSYPVACFLPQPVGLLTGRVFGIGLIPN